MPATEKSMQRERLAVIEWLKSCPYFCEACERLHPELEEVRKIEEEVIVTGDGEVFYHAERVKATNFCFRNRGKEASRRNDTMQGAIGWSAEVLRASGGLRTSVQMIFSLYDFKFAVISRFAPNSTWTLTGRQIESAIAGIGATNRREVT